ncbi:MAG: hypothetical protein ABR598_09135 [Candidatus Dormibacteria bacterium]
MDRDSLLGRRRWRVLLLLALVLLLGYPVLLVVSTRAGLFLGLQRDVNARSELVRALNYAGDRDSAVRFVADTGQPPIAPLDPRALIAQTTDDPSATSSPAASELASPEVSPAPSGAAARPTPRPGPTAAPRPAPAPSATSCPSPPTGTDHLNLHAAEQGGAPVVGASVRIYYHGCLFGTGTTNAAGRMTNVGNLAPNTTYTYVVSATGYQDATGSFDTPGTSYSNVQVEVVMTLS